MLPPRSARATRRARLSLAAAALLQLGSSSPAIADDVGLRIRFGLTDVEPAPWNGSIEVAPGKVVGLSGWRFAKRDAVLSNSTWTATSRPISRRRRSNKRGYERNVDGPVLDNGVVVNLADVTEDSKVRIQTPRGRVSFALRDVPYGTTRVELDGAVEIDRTGTSTILDRTPTDEDFPAMAMGADGLARLAWVSFTRGASQKLRVMQLREEPDDFGFLSEPTGGDQVWLKTLGPGGSEPVAITEPGRDVYKCAIAIDGEGRTWVFWSEQRDGQFDIWARSYKDGRLGEPMRLSKDGGNDLSPVATTDAQGRVWLAWQGARDGVFRILLRRQLESGEWSEERVLSTSARSSWAPAIAATRAGDPGEPRVAVTWDTYDKGDYDVLVRELSLDGEAKTARPAANTPSYEARSTAAYDRQGRLWIAWEQSGATWGKDFGLFVQRKGIPLYSDRQIGLRVLAPDGKWLAPLGRLNKVMPRFRMIRGTLRQRGPEEPSEAARAAAPFVNHPYHNLSRLTVDAEGRPWLLFRSRVLDFRPTPGSLWLEFAAYYDGRKWHGPILVPQSDNLLSNLPAVAAPPGGGLLLAYSSDHRQNDSARSVPYEGPLAVEKALDDPWVNDLFLGRLTAPAKPPVPELRPAVTSPAENVAPSPATLAERERIDRSRKARTSLRGKELRLRRGEFHRHTEISSDGGVDGPLEDMWRYAIDVADMDWIGNGDHDSGHQREYPWWMIQKTTDAFQLPGFTTLFSYERSVPFPEGHRNVVFPQRGIRPLPRLPMSATDSSEAAADTTMLHHYLERFGGIAAPHTSATNMGTDWRNPSADVEPFVEIYQGSRHSYEMEGAPRTPTAKTLGFHPEGFVSRALAKGHRLGFVSSSDHNSTHISYAMVWTSDGSREGLLDAMKARRVYAATDNIIADVRMVSGKDERFMGESMEATDAPTMRIVLEGTAPFARVVVVRDGKEVHTIQPGAARVEHEWTDPEPPSSGTSHYYVRGEQDDGELVWTSPIWVTYGAKGGE